MAQPFVGKVVWITGASSGIGECVALEMARQGADLALSARRVERLEAVAEKVRALGRRAVVLPCDVTREPALAAAVAEVVAKLGRLDIAIANAGFGVMGPIESLSADDWRRQFETNVVAAAATARHAIPELKKTRGQLVLVGSAAAFITAPKAGCYSASKAAVRVMGQTLAMELHGSGVTCTTIHPGFVASEIAQVDNQGRRDPARRDPRPQAFMWPTDRAARVMVRAIAKRKREYTFTVHGKLGAFVGSHFPGLVHFAMTRTGAKKVGDRREAR